MRAEAVAKDLGGHRAGSTWMARCPAHADSTPSLSIREGKGGKLLVHCHAGCAQREVTAALKERGLWGPALADAGTSSRQSRYRCVEVPDPDTKARTKKALSIWRASRPAEGTLVETYLRSRGLTIVIPPSIRFHPGLKHPMGGIWPAMIALVTDGVSGEPIGILRTFLDRDGCGKAPVVPAKMMLGPCRGGVVRLGEPGEVLMVAEGIETALSAMQATGLPAWAALSTSGLRSLELPKGVREVIVLADGDDAGEKAAQECARRLAREGRHVRIARPPFGKDFNDLLVVRDNIVGGRK